MSTGVRATRCRLSRRCSSSGCATGTARLKQRRRGCPRRARWRAGVARARRLAGVDRRVAAVRPACGTYRVPPHGPATEQADPGRGGPHGSRRRDRYRQLGRRELVYARGGGFSRALRSFLRRRTFVVTVVLMLALALSIPAVVLSTVDRHLGRPLDLVDLDRLFTLQTRGEDGSFSPLSHPEYLHLRDMGAEAFTLATFGQFDFTLVAGSAATRVNVVLVSGNFFTVLGARPAHGRPLSPTAVGEPAGSTEPPLSAAATLDGPHARSPRTFRPCSDRYWVPLAGRGLPHWTESLRAPILPPTGSRGGPQCSFTHLTPSARPAGFRRSTGPSIEFRVRFMCRARSGGPDPGGRGEASCSWPSWRHRRTLPSAPA